MRGQHSASGFEDAIAVILEAHVLTYGATCDLLHRDALFGSAVSKQLLLFLGEAEGHGHQGMVSLRYHALSARGTPAMHATPPGGALRLENWVAEGESKEHVAPVSTEAEVVFVRGDEGHYHRVWVTRDDGTTFGLRIHVAHDLPHFAVESAFSLWDGLWGHIVATGDYLGLTVEHLVVKALTNAIAPSVDAMRERLATFHRDEVSRRDSFDADAAASMLRLLEHRLRALDDATARRASEMRAALLERWGSTAVGEKMTLHWPLNR